MRANGTREIGPNAVLVSGPGAYKGLSEKKTQIISKIFERPLGPKLNLFTSKTFLSLVWHEWRSSISKSAMSARVKEFIPSIDSSLLKERGLAGVRASVIDENGFVPAANYVLKSEYERLKESTQDVITKEKYAMLQEEVKELQLKVKNYVPPTILDEMFEYVSFLVSTMPKLDPQMSEASS